MYGILGEQPQLALHTFGKLLNMRSRTVGKLLTKQELLRQNKSFWGYGEMNWQSTRIFRTVKILGMIL